jgi:hypothetical protein
MEDIVISPEEPLNRQLVPVQIDNGYVMYIEALDEGGVEKVADFGAYKFDQIKKTLEFLGVQIRQSFETMKPQKATVEFDLKVALKEGQLTGLLCQGSSEANIKVTLEWNDDRP